MRILKSARVEIKRFVSVVFWCFSLSWSTSKFYTMVRISGEIASPLILIALSFVGKYIIDLLSGGDTYFDTTTILFIFAAVLLALALLRSGIQKLTSYAHSVHDDILNTRISIMLMEHSLSADLEYFDNPKYHDKLQSASQDSYAITSVVWNVISCISSSVTFLSAFIILAGVNILYGILMLIAAIPASFAAARYTKSIYGLSLEQINGQRKMYYNQSVATERRHAQEIRLFGAGSILKERYLDIWTKLFNKKRRMVRKRALITGGLEFLPEVLCAVLGVDIALRIIAGGATVGDYSLYTGLVAQLWSAVSVLSHGIMQIYENRLKIENHKSLNHFKNKIEDTGIKKLDCVNSIEFSHVSFSYPGTRKKVLQDICLTLCKEEKIALVGLNGSGKSTLIKLLLRMYEPDSGVICINGYDIREYKLSELRANFSAYFQETSNYCFTLRENFVFSDKENKSEDSAMEEAICSAGAQDIFLKAEKGLDTSLTKFFEPDGLELSGGQHQKIALARSFYRRHTALILDEPSSNLDPKAEHDVFERLREITDGKMTIFTSHRLSNVFLADRIIVLENGCVIEDGTQQELLKNQHRYAELFKYQQDKFSASEVN